ncbi:MAG: cupin domain-containing protein [Nitrincola sp.]|nr:cupin domain-containing protein [Nitrincola sp.]
MNTPLPLGDMSLETFLRDYWQKKPLVIRNAIADFKSPVEADELAGLACEAEVESRLIAFDAAANQWKMEQGPFEEARFANLPETNWTLLVQAVDHWVPEAHSLLRQFNFIPNWRLDDLMVSFAVKGGGVGPHYDNYDVFLIQAQGSRRWEFGGLYDEHSPRREDAPVMILPEWQAETSVELNPGDLLYLPPRVGHNGVATSDDCITCSIGFRAPATHEMLRSFSDDLGESLGHDERYEDPDLTQTDDPGLISEEALQRAHQLLLNHLSDKQRFREWFGRFVTEPKYPEQQDDSEEVTAEELIEFLESDGELFINEGSRLSWVAADTGVIFFADGHSYPLSTEPAIALIKSMCEYSNLCIENTDIADAQSIQLICTLLKRGLLYSINPDDETED